MNNEVYESCKDTSFGKMCIELDKIKSNKPIFIGIYYFTTNCVDYYNEGLQEGDKIISAAFGENIYYSTRFDKYEKELRDSGKLLKV